MDNPLDLPLVAIAGRLRAGELTCAALIEAAIDRHDAFGEILNAYKFWDPDMARAMAHAADAAFTAGTDLGPLHGIPVSVKDLFGVKGWPMYAGSPNPLPKALNEEGPLVSSLRRQGAVLVGKTHTPEFAFDGLGLNLHWGSLRNPWDADHHRVAGGSSSGAAVCLIEGSALLALGSDSGGSVRMPAAMTGVASLKPTYGRWPLDGIVPFSPSLDSPGPIARSIADVVYAFSALDPGLDRSKFARHTSALDLKDVKLGVCDRHFFDNCSPGVAEGVRAAIEELEQAGAQVVSFDLPEVEAAYKEGLRGNTVAAEFHSLMRELLPDWLDTLNPYLAERLARFDKPESILATDYLATLRALRRLSVAATDRLRAVDALVCPTVVCTPPQVDELSTLEAYRERNFRVHQNTYLVNLLGLCALNIPVAGCGGNARRSAAHRMSTPR